MKIIKILIVVVLCLVIGFGCWVFYGILLSLGGIEMLGNNKKYVQNFFDSNYEELSYLNDYVSSVQCDSLRWYCIDENKFTLYYKGRDETEIISETEIIADEKYLTYISQMKGGSLCAIIKESNYVKFSVLAALDSSCGVVYCEQYPQIEYNGEVRIEELEKNNWYYYKQISN